MYMYYDSMNKVMLKYEHDEVGIAVSIKTVRVKKLDSSSKLTMSLVNISLKF